MKFEIEATIYRTICETPDTLYGYAEGRPEEKRLVRRDDPRLRIPAAAEKERFYEEHNRS